MRRLIRKIFNRFGYEIVRKGNKHHSNRSKRKKLVRVGNYTIGIPGNNTLLGTYTEIPDFNTHFSRLVLAVARKYPKMAVVDIGANVGDTVARIKTEIDVPILAIEGDDISYSYLEENLKQFTGVRAVKTYLGEKSGELKAKVHSAGWNTTIVPGNSSDSIPIKTLDEVLSKEDFPNIKLIKTDTEGFDTIILRGSLQTIDHLKPVLFFEYSPQLMDVIGEKGLSTVFSFREFGYDRIIFVDNMGSVILSTRLNDTPVITSMHDYLAASNDLIAYYDICIFHSNDSDIAEFYLAEERRYHESIPK